MTATDNKITFTDPPKSTYQSVSLVKALFDAARSRPGEWATATIPPGSYKYWAMKYANEGVEVTTRHIHIENGKKVCDLYVKFPV